MYKFETCQLSSCLAVKLFRLSLHNTGMTKTNGIKKMLKKSTPLPKINCRRNQSHMLANNVVVQKSAMYKFIRATPIYQKACSSLPCFEADIGLILWWEQPAWGLEKKKNRGLWIKINFKQQAAPSFGYLGCAQPKKSRQISILQVVP